MTFRILAAVVVLNSVAPAGAQPLATPRQMAAARGGRLGRGRHPAARAGRATSSSATCSRRCGTSTPRSATTRSCCAAPAAPVKARWVSNGSGVNLRADKPPMWKEAGTPVAFFVGEKGEPFGADVDAARRPAVRRTATCRSCRWPTRSGGAAYEQEAFAPVRGAVRRRTGRCVVRFTVRDASRVG